MSVIYSTCLAHKVLDLGTSIFRIPRLYIAHGMVRGQVLFIF